MKDKSSFFDKLIGTNSRDKDSEEESVKTPRVASANEATWFDDEQEEGELTVDVYQTPTEIIIKSMVAGVKPEDLDISITRDMVIIKGKRETERSVQEEDYFHKELYWGSFSRTIMLPAEIEVEESEAVEKHGLLIIRMPKIDKNRQQKLRVKG